MTEGERLIEELREITMVPGMSGYEERVREKIKEWLDPYVDTETDTIGNLVAKIGEGEVKGLFMAHMDEIGLLITGVTDDGKLTFRKIGGIDDRLLYGRHLSIVTEDGVVDGLIGAESPHLGLNERVVRWEEMTIDVGARSREEALKLVKPLDFAVFKKHFSVLNGRYVSTRSLDDRFGVVTLVEAIKDLVDHDLDGTYIFAFTVQEEIGLKGARFLAKRYRPEYAFAVDSFACCSKLTGDVEPGKGPVIRAVDGSAIYTRRLAREVMEIASKNRILLQIGVTGGATDASVFQDISEVLALSVPIKYLHSEVEMLSVDDLKALIKLLEAIVLEL